MAVIIGGTVLAIAGELILNPDNPVPSQDSVQLVMISSITHNPTVNSVGDIIGIFDGGHPFSENEKHSFIIVRVNGVTREQMENELNKLLPDTSKFTEEEMRIKVTQPKYKFNLFGTGTITVSNLSSKIKTNVKLK